MLLTSIFPRIIGCGVVLALSFPPSYAHSSFSTNNSTYNNPAIPGFHPDPSCVAVDDTVFCVTSSFLTFPGLPVYASKDLQNWRHISNVFHVKSQLPGLANVATQNGGIYAPTIRYREGTFYVLTTFVGDESGLSIICFKSDDPFNSSAWTTPLRWSPQPQEFHFDPDLFWDDDGQAYITAAYFVQYKGVGQYPIDLEIGVPGKAVNLWNGTGGFSPEGPRVFKKDGYYYICMAEGGTGLGHKQTIARARNRTGPFESFSGNPILSNANTSEYFQTVGHSDFFQDLSGNWWSVALATRSGPMWATFPMGRETSLLPVTWKDGEWPVISKLQGNMTGWHFPPTSHDIGGEGRWIRDGDDYKTFDLDIPSHFGTFRFAPNSSYAVAKGQIKLNPSSSNLTGPVNVPRNETGGISYIGRRQTDTLFTFSVDMEYLPVSHREEAGITLFLTQDQHIDLSIIFLDNERYLSFRSISYGANNETTTVGAHEELIVIPAHIRNASRLRLQVDALDEYEYVFCVGDAHQKLSDCQHIGRTSSNLVSGGEGQFMGTFMGIFATSNGGSGTVSAYFSNWVYCPKGQKISN